MAAYLAEVIGFLLLLAFIYHYVRPPLKKLMNAQAESIRSSLVQCRCGRGHADSACSPRRVPPSRRRVRR